MRVEKGRANPRRIGENPNPAGLKLLPRILLITLKVDIKEEYNYNLVDITAGSAHKDKFYNAYKEGRIYTYHSNLASRFRDSIIDLLKLSEKDSHGVFLESVEGGENLGRWSIVATKPLWEASCYGKEIVKTWKNGKTEIHKGDPFDILRIWTKEYNSSMLEGLPSIGQLYGSWGYELINRIEPTVPINEIEENTIPYGSWMFFDQLVVFDQIKRCITAVVYADTTSLKESSIEEVYQNSISKIKKTRNLMKVPLKEKIF